MKFHNNKNFKLGQKMNQSRKIQTMINVQKYNELKKKEPIVVSSIEEPKKCDCTHPNCCSQLNKI